MANSGHNELLALARTVTDTFVRHADVVAAAVSGSVATGRCDEWSDIDLILFYERWPGFDALAAARSTLAVHDRRCARGAGLPRAVPSRRRRLPTRAPDDDRVE